MKQKILYILMIITALLGGNTEAWAWGEQTSYVIENNATQVIMNDVSSGKTREFTWNSGHAQTLSFEVIGYDSWIFPFTGGCEVNVYNKDNKPILTKSFDISTSWTTKTIENISDDAVKISIIGKGTLKKEIRNVKVTRATTLTPSPSSIDWGDVQLGETRSQEITISYNNTTYNQELKAECSNSSFSIDKNYWSIGEYGEVTFNVSFTATTIGPHSGTIVLTRGETNVAEIPVSANVVGKYTPNFNFSLETAYANHVYNLSDIFSTNSPTPYTITSNDESKAKIMDGKLYVLAQSGDFSLIVSQEGNEQWNAKKGEKQITISDKNSETYFLQKDDITLSEWRAKTLSFSFPTSKVTCTYSKDGAAIDYGLLVNISKNHGNSFENIDELNPTDSEQTFTKEFSDLTTTHIEFDRDGGATLNAYVKNIKFHMASYMTPSQTSVTFGRTMVGNTSEVPNITIDWSDVDKYSDNLKVMCDNPNFSVSVVNNPCTPANQTWGTSNQRWGQSTVSVKYTPTEEGNHTGNIYFYDNKRFITIPVSGEAYRPLNLSTSIEPSTQITKDDHYSLVTLEREFKAGYSTVTIPFDYDIDDNIRGAKAAQLTFVTYNSQDEYTLYLQEIENGKMLANQPYVVYLPSDITNPRWTDVTVKVPVAEKITLDNWTMQGNYTPGLSMEGNYGIAGGKFCLGTEKSSINAYTAYFTFHGTENVRTRVAVMDEGGNTTYIGELKDGVLQTEEGIYGLDGIQQNQLRKGINIVRQKDGSVRKIVK